MIATLDTYIKKNTSPGKKRKKRQKREVLMKSLEEEGLFFNLQNLIFINLI
jgi:hypothetical protein